eukprot:2245950-Alexandrium_andersonii.AAC.1
MAVEASITSAAAPGASHAARARGWQLLSAPSVHPSGHYGGIAIACRRDAMGLTDAVKRRTPDIEL